MSRRRRRGRRKRGNWFSRLSLVKKIGVTLGGVFLCLAASGVVFVAAKLGRVATEDIPTEDIVVNKEAEQVGEGYTNVALFGIDSRNGELEIGTRSDCIIVASLNNRTKEVRMVSVYRDTLLDIGNSELQKCNAAYSFGGPTAAINMLNKNLDLNIQDFATVDFAAIANAIDMLGGVEIDVNEVEVQYLNKFLGETAWVAGKEAHKVTSPGLQMLDGVQATTYARIRSTAGGDFKRAERQRLVIEKIVEKAQQSDLATINKIIDSILPTIKTSFTGAEILSYAKDFMKYKIGESSGFPFDKTTDTISGLGSIVIPVSLESNVKKLHEFLYDEMDYSVSGAVSSISNAVVTRVGQRNAENDDSLNNRTYTQSAEDEAQETNRPSSGKKPSKDDKPSGGASSGGSSSGENNSSGESGSQNPPEAGGGSSEQPSIPDNGGESSDSGTN